ncbi:hypothetical protein J2Z83_002429 [Virgibacillus natechei]|uniref:Uncharacterized protein n=1 Tax=Virgibacillus natechei TaxID=1216297 RepID=A0ABS4IIY6_9BACI|nr:hypothetical protein [Virgibacillus natechei]MBP1970311.1 hypothetical protein [Virgibacillus natechei]UZD13139.1 hypothetical protein OLD84_00745 [Virgibacillus natechei]
MRRYEELHQELIKKVEPKIRKSINSIPEKYREDVKQDLMEKIIKSADNVKYEDVPGFYDFIKEEQKKKLNVQDVSKGDREEE